MYYGIMNNSKFALASFAGFAYIFVFEWVFHGMLLRESYMATSHLWRSVEEMNELFPVAMLIQLAIAVLGSYVFIQNYENKGAGEGLRFGLIAGLVMGVMMFGSYPYSPIPLSLGLSWLIGGIVEGIGFGLVLSMTYKN